MRKRNQRHTEESEPKNRRERIERLIERGDLKIDLYAKALGKRKDNVLRTLRNSQEINSLDYIMEAYFCMNGEVSLTWLITGGHPIKAPVKIFTYQRVDVRERLEQLFKSENLSFKTVGEFSGISRDTIQRMLNGTRGKESKINGIRKAPLTINVNHVIAIHLLTGCNFDYMLDGIGPKYVWDKERDIVDFLNAGE